MSYILDALRRAERERAAAAAPDLQARLTTPVAAATTAPRPIWPWLVGLALGLVAGLAVPWVWRWGAGEQARVTAAAAPVTASPGADPGAAPSAAVATVTGAVPAPVAVAAASMARPPAPLTAPTASMAAAASTPVRAAAPEPPFLPPAPRPRVAAAAPPPRGAASLPGTSLPIEARPAATPAAGPAPAASSAAPIVPRDALPDDVRRRLPELRLGGSMHSPVPANRLLIVDGQVAREGDTVAPGLVLEQIRPRSAVFRFGTHRYEWPL